MHGGAAEAPADVPKDAVPAYALPQRPRKRSRVRREEQKPEYKFEYLDHTADIQIHSWGDGLAEAFEHAGHAMYNYMVPLDCIDVNPRVAELRVRASGHDEQSLLYNFLQELLFDFHTEFRACWCAAPPARPAGRRGRSPPRRAARVRAEALTTDRPAHTQPPRTRSVLRVVSLDLEAFTLECVGRGDIFDRNVHASGTEIKAITYSAMHIRHGDQKAPENGNGSKEANEGEGAEDGGSSGRAGAAEAGEGGAEDVQGGADATARHGADVYVIVDI